MRRHFLVGVGVVAVVVAVVAAWGWQRSRETAKLTAQPGSAHAASGAKPRAPAQPAALSGRVTRKSDGVGLAGAIVSIARADFAAELVTSEVPTIVVTTDPTGAWTAAAVAPGDYVLSATAPGFVPGTRDKLAVASGQQRTGLEFALDPGGTVVRGTVTDVGGGPIAGARITGRREGVSLSRDAELCALSGADGTYQLHLLDGSYRLEAMHDDYTRARRSVDVAGKPATSDFTLIPGGVIRGRVVAHESGEPVANAMVQLSGRHARGGRQVVRADGDGNFTLRQLGSGAMSIEARGHGYASAAPTIVELGIGEQVDGVQVKVDRAFSIAGRVVKKSAPKHGVPGVMLGAFSFTGGGQQTAAPEVTDSEGRFEIPGVRKGNYMLFAGIEGMMLEIGKTVEVIDRDITDVVIEMSTGTTLAGRVEPPEVASIGLELQGDVGLGNMFEMIKTSMVRGESDASGAFVLRNVPPGVFDITAMTKQGRAGKLAVTVAIVDLSGLVIKLSQRASISGRLVDTNGKPVAAVRVHARRDEARPPRVSMGERGAAATSGADGTFKLVGLEAGTYELTAELLDDLFEPRKDKKKKLEVEVAEGVERTGVTLTIEARDGVIRGQVIDADRQPVADAWVSARRERERAVGMPGRAFDFMMQGEPVLTDGSGNFMIDKLRRGSYTVIAEGPRGSSRGEKSGVKAGDSVAIVLASLGTLVLRVTAGGAPVRAFELSCRGPTGSIERSAAAADGTYTLERLAPGEYECEVETDDGTAKGKVTVPAGPAELDLEMTPWASLTGVVVNVLTGKPVPGIMAITSGPTRSMMAALTGNGATTDANGRFVIERVAVGSGRLTLMPKDQLTLIDASRNYTVKSGERLDLGTVKIVPPRTGEAGTYGLAAETHDKVVTVTSVKPGGPAEQAGVKVGDTITSVEGQAVTELGAAVVARLIGSGNVDVGQTVTLGLGRGASVRLTAIKW